MKWFNLNLAPVNYDKFLRDEKLIDYIVSFQHDSKHGIRMYTCNIRLNSNLRDPNSIKQSGIYANYDGSGTDRNRSIAIYKAVSECLERWAYYKSHSGSKYGFNLDKSTTGLASFPELFTSNVRANAYLESVERTVLKRFSQKQAPAKLLANRTEYFELLFEIFPTGEHVALLYKDLKTQHSAQLTRCYGFAAGISASAASTKALVELERNEVLLSSDKFRNAQFSSLNILDRRLIFFAGKEGSTFFDELVKQALAMKEDKFELPKTPIVDEEVKGPWSVYGKVWRYLHEVCHDNFIQNESFFTF